MLTAEKINRMRQRLFLPVEAGGMINGVQVSQINVEDADGAAAAGVAVYVHCDELLEDGSYIGHLEFVSPTNADGTGTIANGGAGYAIRDDDDAATAGAALYIDEDAATLDERFLATTTTARDVRVMLSDGRFMKIKYHADPGTPGVQVYFDEDAANSYQRLLFVSPTNADGAVNTDDEFSLSMAKNTLISAGTGGAPRVEIGTLGVTGLKMVLGNIHNYTLPIPPIVDLHQNLRFRVIWASEAAAAGTSVTWQIAWASFAYGEAIVVGSGALDTAIAADGVAGTAKVIQATEWGVLKGGTIPTADDILSLAVTVGADDTTVDNYLIGVEIEYTPRLSAAPSVGREGRSVSR